MTLLVTVVNPATSESMVYVICGKVDPFVQQTSLNLDASNTHTHTPRDTTTTGCVARPATPESRVPPGASGARGSGSSARDPGVVLVVPGS